MSIQDIQYPEVILNALNKPSHVSKKPHLSRVDAFQNYARNSAISRTPAIWRAFRVILLNSDVARFSTAEWNLPGCNIGSFMCETDESVLEDLHLYGRHFGGYRVIDADVGDGGGRIFRVRIVYNYGDGDANTGFWGKAFERPCDCAAPSCRPRVFAEIKSCGDSETSFDVAADAGAEFVDRPALAAWIDLLDREMTPIKFDCQFGFLLGLAVVLHQDRDTGAPPIYMRDGLPLQRHLLRSLGRPREDYVVSKVLFEAGPVQELIAQFASEMYVSCSNERDASLDWYFNYGQIRPVVLARAQYIENDGTTVTEDALKDILEPPEDYNVLNFDYEESLWTNPNTSGNGEPGVWLETVGKVLTLDWADGCSPAGLYSTVEIEN